jgi:hypothetical protein
VFALRTIILHCDKPGELRLAAIVRRVADHDGRKVNLVTRIELGLSGLEKSLARHHQREALRLGFFVCNSAGAFALLDSIDISKSPPDRSHASKRTTQLRELAT